MAVAVQDWLPGKAREDERKVSASRAAQGQETARDVVDLSATDNPLLRPSASPKLAFVLTNAAGLLFGIGFHFRSTEHEP